MSGFTTTGASVVTDFDEINRSLGDVAPVHAMARRHGDHCARDCRAPSAPSRWPSAHGVGAPRPGVRRHVRAHSGPPLAGCSFYVALTVLQTLMLTSLWLFGIDRADDALSGPRPFILDHADGRLLDAATLRRGFFGGVAVDPRALHADRGSQLCADVSRARSGGGPTRSPATRSFAWTPHSPWLQRPRLP